MLKPEEQYSIHMLFPFKDSKKFMLFPLLQQEADAEQHTGVHEGVRDHAVH